jgi:lipopolysaccharide/colanic/teichoic acid biosynthesis glycosyltransferase
MKCIFCGYNNIDKQNTTDIGCIISCNNCNGKYYYKGKWKNILNYPKNIINPNISIILMLLILPISLIIYFIESNMAKNIINNKIFQLLIIVYTNITLIPMNIYFFQNIYNYFMNGFIIIKGTITTKEDSIFIRIFDISISLIGGMVILLILICMNTKIIKYIFKI